MQAVALTCSLGFIPSYLIHLSDHELCLGVVVKSVLIVLLILVLLYFDNSLVHDNTPSSRRCGLLLTQKRGLPPPLVEQ